MTSDRCSLSKETAEDLVKICLNLAKLAEEERVCGLGGGAEAAAVDVVYRPEQDREEEVIQEDSTESESDEFDM